MSLKLQKLCAIISGTIIVSLIIYGFTCTYVLDKSGLKQIKMNFVWGDEPILINCFGSPYSIDEVRLAAKFVEETSKFKFFGITDNFSCPLDGSPVSQSIIIHPVINPSDQRLANAAGLTTYSRRGVVIQIAIKVERVLEHELFHAIGFDHLVRVGHIMHPHSSLGGWDVDGLLYPSITKESTTYPVFR
jgi:hypothetical protein